MYEVGTLEKECIAKRGVVRSVARLGPHTKVAEYCFEGEELSCCIDYLRFGDREVIKVDGFATISLALRTILSTNNMKDGAS